MRFNFKNRKDLECIETGILCGINTDYSKKYNEKPSYTIRWFKSFSNALKKTAASKKYIVSAIFDKIKDSENSENSEKLINEYLTHNSIIYTSGIIIFSGTIYCYLFTNKTATVFLINKQGVLADVIHLPIDEDGCIETSKKNILVSTLHILAFLKYAEIETVELKPKEKKKLFDCKYLNETNETIEIIDSSWFRTIINSEGFNVRGHFRLQPKKKDGKWTKELIWINEFKKKGFVRKAKRLKQNDI